MDGSGAGLFRRTGLFGRILFVGGAVVLAYTLTLSWLYVKFRNTTYSANQLKIKHVVETTCSLIEQYAKAAGSGAMSDEEARRAALEAVKGMKFDEGNNYFWINDMGPRMVMHPQMPDLDGKDLSDYADPKGK